jgi:hypothetical protein
MASWEKCGYAWRRYGRNHQCKLNKGHRGAHECGWCNDA